MGSPASEKRRLGKGKADVWTRAPSRCTRTCCRAARPTPWPPSPFRRCWSCQSLSVRRSICDLVTSGCSSTSAQGGLRSHPQLGSPLGALAPLLGSLRLRVRRLSGGYNWPGLEARAARMGQLIPRRGEPGPPLSSRGASGVQGQPGSSRPQVRGRRRLLFPFGCWSDGRASREAPQL